LAFFPDADWSGKGARIDLLRDHLLQSYPVAHVATLYEASPYPTVEPRVEYVELGQLLDCKFSTATTMIVPPASAPTPSEDILVKLGMRIVGDRLVVEDSQVSEFKSEQE